MPDSTPGKSIPVIQPDALRCPELHDFSDLRDADGGIHRLLIVVLALVAILSIGHFVREGWNTSPVPTPIAQEPGGLMGRDGGRAIVGG